jgi:hypothetical protein
VYWRVVQPQLKPLCDVTRSVYRSNRDNGPRSRPGRIGPGVSKAPRSRLLSSVCLHCILFPLWLHLRPLWGS